MADDVDFPDEWSATKNVAWKTSVPGRGWSSPVVWGDHVFLTTVVNTAASEAPVKGLYLGGNRLKPPKSGHEWKVLCLDLTGGQVRVERTVHRGLPKSPVHFEEQLRLGDSGHGLQSAVRLLRQHRLVLPGPGRQDALGAVRGASEDARWLGNGRFAGPARGPAVPRQRQRRVILPARP